MHAIYRCVVGNGTTRPLVPPPLVLPSFLSASFVSHFRIYTLFNLPLDDRKKANAHWLNMTTQGGYCYSVCLWTSASPSFTCISGTHDCVFVFVCLCVCVTLTAEVLDPISEVADSLTLRERNKDNYQTSNDWGDCWGKCALTCCYLQFTNDSSTAECLFVGFVYLFYLFILLLWQNTNFASGRWYMHVGYRTQHKIMFLLLFSLVSK